MAALYGSATVKPLAGRFTNMWVGEGGGGRGEERGGCSGLTYGRPIQGLTEQSSGFAF